MKKKKFKNVAFFFQISKSTNTKKISIILKNLLSIKLNLVENCRNRINLKLKKGVIQQHGLKLA